MTQATRAQFLSRGAKGGIALVAGSSLLAVTGRRVRRDGRRHR